MSRLSAAFATRGKCFIAYVTAGYPDLATSEEIILGLADAGAGIVEIGLPFSDPVADGPVIQAAMLRALKHNHSLDDYLGMVARLREKTDAGLLLMTYLNPLWRYGISRFRDAACEAGLDGVLISDLPPEEREMLRCFEGLDTVMLAAPTSSDGRLRRIANASTGFIYMVARTGITGAATDVGHHVPALAARLREMTSTPLAAGFGIGSADDVEAVWRHADGAVVGTAVIRIIERCMIADGGTAADVVEEVARTLIPNGIRNGS